MIKLGIIGLSEGNGHPFSFSAILNGYSDDGFEKSEWPVIHQYLKRRELGEFRSFDARVTHAWTQDPAITSKLCAASLIPHAVEKIEDMLGEVDAVILARDDYESHRAMAEPILKRGLRIFIDKPLCASFEDLDFFRPYVESGQVISFSPMRYATEMDQARQGLQDFGTLKLLQGTVLSSWEKYGIHMLDAFIGLGVDMQSVKDVVMNPGHYASAAFANAAGTAFQISTLGMPTPRCFRVSIYGSQKIEHFDIHDNFAMFRRSMGRFVDFLRGASCEDDAQKTLITIPLLIQGRRKR